MNFRIIKFTTLNKNLEAIWKKIEDNSNVSVFQNYDWNAYWYKNLQDKKNYKLRVLVIENQKKEQIAIFPFVVELKYSFSILKMMSFNVSDYCMPLIANKINDQKLIKEIFNEVISYNSDINLIYLDNLAENFNNNKIYFKNYIRVNYKFSAYSLDYNLTSNNDLIIPKKISLDNNRQVKRLKSIGAINYHKSSNKHEYQDLFKILVSFKRSLIPYKGYKIVFDSNDIFNFYYNIPLKFNKNLTVELLALKLDSEVISISWGVTYKNRYYYIFPSYSPLYSKYSPGKLLLEKQLKSFDKNKLKVFDFTIGDESYKKKYCNTTISIYRHYKTNGYMGPVISSFIEVYFFILRNQFIRALIVFFRRQYFRLIKI